MGLCLGIILTIIGYLLKEIEKKRHFDRTNASGVEGYNSYLDLKVQNFINFCLRFSGFVLMGIGILIVISKLF